MPTTTTTLHAAALPITYQPGQTQDEARPDESDKTVKPLRRAPSRRALSVFWALIFQPHRTISLCRRIGVKMALADREF